ncbi:MAG: molybdenum cofactor guanylyltransferase [Microbacterium sp.]|uniref:molybdenum cofactor guanylyltransferase n=1 Tax=Microbacterium sp. TaxID=51671 RepID=UPI003A89C574
MNPLSVVERNAGGVETTRGIGAILLAGGRATRVGGAAKPLFEVGGRTLMRTAVDAVRDAGARPITVVGPVLDPGLPVDWVREDPPFGGPAAGIVAALESWRDDPAWTFLLACDLARADLAVARLVADLTLVPAGTDGVCLADASSRPQWLTGAYRTAALRDAASTLPSHGRNLPVRALLDDLAIAVVTAPDATDDVDTWEDLKRAKERFDG